MNSNLSEFPPAPRRFDRLGRNDEDDGVRLTNKVLELRLPFFAQLEIAGVEFGCEGSGLEGRDKSTGAIWAVPAGIGGEDLEPSFVARPARSRGGI